MEILLILFIIFIVFPLVRVLFSVGKTVHTFRKAYKEQTDAFRQAQQSHTGSQTASQKPRDSKKRRAIDLFKKSSEDAEYVEIKGERSPQPDIDTTSSSSSAKPRVSDAQFEDIK